MSFLPQLSAGQLQTLRGTGALAPSYQSGAYISAVPNVTVFAARVNQASFTASYAQVTFDTVTVGAYTDLVPGMTVLISATNDRTKPVFTGRVRKAATSTVIFINETSAALADNYYIFVLADFRLWDKLGRQVSNVQYTDFETTFRQLLPVIYNLKAAYAGFVSGGVLTISFAPSALAATSGASISTWAWNVGDGTITVGSSSTQNITATFPPGHRWVYLTVTDSGGRSQTRKISVHAHAPDTYPPVPLQAGDLSLSGSVETGFEASVAAWAGVSGLLDYTQIVIWYDERYQDSTTALTGDNIAFVGRMRESSDSAAADPVVGIAAETRYTLVGPLQQLSHLEMLPYEFLYKASPAAFFEVKNLTVWRACCLLLSEFSTFLELYSLTFDSTSDSFLTIGLRTQGNNILSAVNDLYFSVNGGMQMDAAGNGQLVRDLRMVSDSLRNAATTVANWTTADILSVESYDHTHVRTVGRLLASGGSYQTANNQNSVFQSLAPGIAQDYPDGSATLDRQVLAANQSNASAQSELNTRAGFAFARAQETDKLTVVHPDGYGFLISALDAWYTFTLDGSETVRGIVLDTSTRWLLISVDIVPDGVTGEKQVRATYAIETTGAAGQSVVYPPTGDTSPPDPTFPPFPPFPAFPLPPDIYLPPDPPPYIGDPDQIPLDGNTVAILDRGDSTVRLTLNAISNGSNPTWRDITPDDEEGFTPRAIARDIWDTTQHGFFCITSNGDLTRTWYASDVFANPPDYVMTSQVMGEYIAMRLEPTPGDLYLYSETSPTALEPCGNFDIGNVEGNTAFGTFLGIFAGKYRYEGESGGDGFYYLTLLTPGDSICCIVNSITVVSGGLSASHNIIHCTDPQLISSFDSFTSPIGQCVNYLAYQVPNPFTIDIEWAEC